MKFYLKPDDNNLVYGNWKNRESDACAIRHKFQRKFLSIKLMNCQQPIDWNCIMKKTPPCQRIIEIVGINIQFKLASYGMQEKTSK